jgi:hypothetical protein
VKRGWALALLSLAACRESGAPRAPLPPIHKISFERQLAPLLAQSCAAERGCHGDEPAHSIDLDLREDRAGASLVAHPSQVRAGAVLVAPGDPANSFLLAKLDGRLGPTEGKQMPLDAATGAPVNVHSPQDIELRTLVEEWIRAGAPAGVNSR